MSQTNTLGLVRNCDGCTLCCKVMGVAELAKPPGVQCAHCLVGQKPLTLDQLDRLKPDDIFRQLYQQKFSAPAPADQLSAFAELMLPGA